MLAISPRRAQQGAGGDERHAQGAGARRAMALALVVMAHANRPRLDEAAQNWARTPTVNVRGMPSAGMLLVAIVPPSMVVAVEPWS